MSSQRKRDNQKKSSIGIGEGTGEKGRVTPNRAKGEKHKNEVNRERKDSCQMGWGASRQRAYGQAEGRGRKGIPDQRHRRVPRRRHM